LILDEPTAALDPASEREVMGALRHLMRGRTAFVIAHRLSTIRNADLILVIENGRIVERGQHADLTQRGGRYAEFVRLQQTPMVSAQWSVGSLTSESPLGAQPGSSAR